MMFIKILIITIPLNKIKILIVFNDMIADIMHNKKLDSIELFTRGRKLNVSLAFITQSYFRVPKDVKLNTTYVFIAKIPNKERFKKLRKIIHQNWKWRFHKYLQRMYC